MVRQLCATLLFLGFSAAAAAAPITNPDDLRSWQGATVGTFAELYYGSNTLVNRQQVVDMLLLDDGHFNATGTPGTLISALGIIGCGYSLDTTGTGSLAYVGSCSSYQDAANAVDEKWIQTSGIVGQTVWDLGGLATRAAIFNTIDHGPLPLEAIESTGYWSNDQINWTRLVVQRVWLEGFQPNHGILWDGYAFAVGTAADTPFRYISIIHGGPGALQSDGDDEINGVMGLNAQFEPNPTAVPEPASLLLLGTGLAFAKRMRRRK